MSPEDPWNRWWIKALAYGLFAMFGGMMGHLMRTLDSREKIKWSRAALEGGAARIKRAPDGGYLVMRFGADNKAIDVDDGVPDYVPMTAGEVEALLA